MNANVRRGDIYYADLSPVVGSEQGGMRPVLIIQNDVGNRYSPTVIAAAITSRMGKTKLPTHIDIYAERAGLSRDSIVLLEQVRTLDKRRLKEKMGHLDEPLMQEIDTAIAVSLGLLPHSARTAPAVPHGGFRGDGDFSGIPAAPAASVAKTGAAEDAGIPGLRPVHTGRVQPLPHSQSTGTAAGTYDTGAPAATAGMRETPQESGTPGASGGTPPVAQA